MERVMMLVTMTMTMLLKVTTAAIIPDSRDTKISDASLQNRYPRQLDYALLGTYMRIAARAGNLEFVQEMLDLGTPVDNTDANGYTPLLWAAYYNRTDVIKLLLNNSADINHQNKNGETALILATAISQSVDVAEILLESGANPNFTNTAGYTALMFASNKGNSEMVVALLNANADPDMQNNEGETALTYAAQIQGLSIIEALLQHGASVDLSNNYGFTALMWAARMGYEDNAKSLLKAGAAKNHQNTYGDTPLMWASLGSDKDMVVLLLKNGADPNMRTHENFTALMGAAIQGNAEIVSLLLAAGADRNVLTAQGLDALTMAIAGGNPDAVKLLISGEGIIQHIVNGSTPLFNAIQSNNTQIVLILLDLCPDPNDKDANNKTALEIAETLNNDEMVNALTNYMKGSCDRLGKQYKVGEIIYQNCEELICHCSSRWRLGGGYDPHCGGRKGQILVKQRLIRPKSQAKG